MRFLFVPMMFMIAGSLLWTGCVKDGCQLTQKYKRWDPVYMQLSDIRVDIQTEGARPLKNPGKMWFYEGYMLVNELKEGIHVIDNSDPANPVKLAFIKIPGNVDIAVRNNMLYADNYMDLLTINISDPLNPQLVKRNENAFPFFYETPGFGWLVDYTPTDVTEVIDCDSPFWGNQWFSSNSGSFFAMDDVMLAANGSSVESISTGVAAASQSVGGSLSRFTITGNYMYIVDQSTLHAYDISAPENPSKASSTVIGWGIETIFPYDNKLFIGSQSGMLIYSLTNPESPAYLSTFAHATMCDPVFIQGNTAYVTLRNGTECQGFNNQLDVVDISDITAPYLVKTYPMFNPFGLSVRNNILYLCDGADGLKVFDVTDRADVADHQLDHVKNFDTYDAIALPGTDNLMIIGKGGFYQFDASDNSNLKQISLIAVE